eukprot:scaffold434_cov358-Prasinococcus_capsulatus_cf.AAC.13
MKRSTASVVSGAVSDCDHSATTQPDHELHLSLSLTLVRTPLCDSGAHNSGQRMRTCLKTSRPPAAVTTSRATTCKCRMCMPSNVSSSASVLLSEAEGGRIGPTRFAAELGACRIGTHPCEFPPAMTVKDT